MATDKAKMLDMALEMLGGDMDGLEGRAATSHSLDDCPDPLTCGMHDDDAADSLSGLSPDNAESGRGVEAPGGVSIEVKKLAGMPTMEGAKAEGDELSPEDEEILRKLLGK